MFRTIVVGHDGSEHAGGAVALALRLRDPAAGRLVLAAIVHGSHARARAVERLEGVAAALPAGVPAEVEVLEALTPALGLAALAAARDADLLVCGATHHHEPGRATGRMTVQRLLHAAPCPIAVASAGRPDELARPRILVAFDGSPEARSAADTAFALAADTGGSVRLCHVLDPVVVNTGHGRIAEAFARSAELDHAAQAALAAAAERAPASVAVERRLITGQPVGRLLEETLDADLLVVGCRRRGAIRRVLGGSVASALVAQTALPVIVTPRPAGDRSPLAPAPR